MEQSAANKRALFERFREETAKQLDFIRTKDPESFLESVQRCEELRKQIDGISNEQTAAQEEKEIKGIVAEILHIREQISALIPEVREYLLTQIKSEQQRNKIQRGYGEMKVKPPSVFFDKRK
jgi:flagellar biosynthesis chaperone FliJ